MSKGHFTSAGASIEYGDASVLFPVDKLDATVHQYREAQRTLTDADEAHVIVVAPTSLATSYALTQHALTTIVVDTLPSRVQEQLTETLDVPLDTFDVIQIGKWTTDSPNHSLAEYANT